MICRDEEGFDWQRTITRLREFNNDILVALWVGPDGKDSDDYIVQVGIRFFLGGGVCLFDHE